MSLTHTRHKGHMLV